MPGKKVEDFSSMDRDASLSVFFNSRGSITVVLGNFNKSAPPRNLDDWDGVALEITLEYFPNEDDPIPLSSPFLTIHPERLKMLPWFSWPATWAVTGSPCVGISQEGALNTNSKYIPFQSI